MHAIVAQLLRTTPDGVVAGCACTADSCQLFMAFYSCVLCASCVPGAGAVLLLSEGQVGVASDNLRVMLAACLNCAMVTTVRLTAISLS
jgi:hypothetical protein